MIAGTGSRPETSCRPKALSRNRHIIGSPNHYQGLDLFLAVSAIGNSPSLGV